MRLPRLTIGLAINPGELPLADGTYFLQERGIHGQVFGHHVKAEEMAVDPRASHREAVQMLMLLGRHLEQLEPLLNLSNEGWESRCVGRTT